jgi:hypothetical protein
MQVDGATGGDTRSKLRAIPRDKLVEVREHDEMQGPRQRPATFGR